MFLQFSRSFGRKFRSKGVVKFLRRLKEAHLLENVEKAGARVNSCKSAKDSSIPATLFTGEVQKCVEK